MSQVKHLTFYTESGGLQTIRVQHYEDRDELVYYGNPFDEAIDGSLRQRLRGTRKQVSVSYEASVEKSEFRKLFNNIKSDFESGKRFIKYSEGTSMTDSYDLVPTDDFRHLMSISNQIGHFSPILDFEEESVRKNMLTVSFLDWGYVSQAHIEAEDYGFITDSATLFEDYGGV